MNDKLIQSLKKYRNKYENLDFHFSNLIINKKLFELEPSEFNKFKLADQFRLVGDFNTSLKLYKSIKVNQIPQSFKPYFYFYFAQLYYDFGNWKNAKLYLYKSIELRINDTAPHIYLSIILMNEGNINESIKVLKIAKRKKGDLDEVYFNLAAKFAILKDMRNALKYINLCLKEDPHFPKAKSFLNDIKNYINYSKVKQS